MHDFINWSIFLTMINLIPTISQKDGNDSCIITEGLRFCESTYPYDKGILIANFGTGQLDPLNGEGKGYIVFHKNGKNEVLIPADGNLSAPKGMFERDGYLYIN